MLLPLGLDTIHPLTDVGHPWQAVAAAQWPEMHVAGSAGDIKQGLGNVPFRDFLSTTFNYLLEITSQ